MLLSRISRIPVALRSSSSALKNINGGFTQNRLISISAPRRGGAGQWSYRSWNPPEKKWEIWADVAGAFMWWWIFWHVFTDYHHLIGHHPFPCVDEWTDAELGIPPDDAEDPELLE